jgi:tRNA (guanine-N7-)-methyltransferase
VPTLEAILIPPETVAEKVDFAAIFGNGRPVEMEIGCGKGGFILRMARSHPERNFFGIEWARAFCTYCADRLARWGAHNARMVRTDARMLILHRIAPASLTAIHAYHPDPWPKKRHHKRRLFTPEFVEAAVRALIPGGRWAIQTDHAEYFEIIRGLTVSRPELELIPFDDPGYGTSADRTETNFETKYLREGRTIYRLAYRRRGTT